MKRKYETKNYGLEEKHWWFITRRNIIHNLIKDMDKDAKILDIGCLGGPLLLSLKKKGFKNIYGLDLSKRSIAVCKKRGLKNVFVMDATKTDFKNEEFDVIIASDVLEHIKNDKKAIFEWNRILKPKGRLLVFVPAFKILWSPHDETNLHHRRYSKSSLTKLLKKAKFKVIKSSYCNFTLFFPALIMKNFQRLFRSKKQEIPSQLFEVDPTINKAVINIIKLENKLLKRFNFPVGISVFAVGEKLGTKNQ